MDGGAPRRLALSAQAQPNDRHSGDAAPSAEEDEREPVYLGVDVARFGEDKSVLIARRGQRVIATKSLGREMDTMRVAGEATMMATTSTPRRSS